jgi:hypothetical protein
MIVALVEFSHFMGTRAGSRLISLDHVESQLISGELHEMYLAPELVIEEPITADYYICYNRS